MRGNGSGRLGSPRSIRWRKGELIGAGAYGRVYMGLNLDSGELIAVKQVGIAVNNSTKERARAHMQELEEEVKLLQNLSHPNIVRYLGTAREEEALNIFLEFVSGGSISSLLGKFGAFTEPVIRMYTRQLLLGLEYLHSNHIMHRDIKGANILVDNKGCIKLADFGASKKVVELATISEAKSMKGTPYWMAPEVIRGTGHNWQADMWSVGCTVIEMATGKPPWSQQFQEVAALFHIGTTKSHPPIPEHLSLQGKDFLLKCLQREPRLRPSATELLKHPFVLDWETQGGLESSEDLLLPCQSVQMGTGIDSYNPISEPSFVDERNWRLNGTANGTLSAAPLVKKLVSPESAHTMESHGVMGRSLQQGDEIGTWNDSFNPISEPSFVDGSHWMLNRTGNAELTSAPIEKELATLGDAQTVESLGAMGTSLQQEDEDEVTESKIRAFLDEKALELKRLQTPLYEELYSLWNEKTQTALGPTESFIAPLSPAVARPPAPCSSKSPSKGSSLSGRSVGIRSSQESETSVSSGSPSGSGAPTSVNCSPLVEIPSPRLNEWRGLLHDTQQPLPSPSLSSSERQRLWKEELQQELQKKREEKRKLSQQVCNSPSPSKEKTLHRYGSRLAPMPQL